MTTSIACITYCSEHPAILVAVSCNPVSITIHAITEADVCQAFKPIVYSDGPPKSLQKRHKEFMNISSATPNGTNSIMRGIEANQSSL